ncbi:MAG: adenylate/guanylate cyclase domain-containing protein [Bacteroidota bacterium]
MLSAKTRRNLGRIVPFGFIWLITGWFFLFVESAATGNRNIDPSAIISITPKVFVFASITVFLVGLLVGTLEVLWLGHLFDKKSFGQKIVCKLGIYITLLLLVIFVLYPFAAGIELGLSPLNNVVWRKFTKFFMSWDFFGTLASILFSLFLSLFYAGISDNLGHGVFMNFFMGKYHKPIVENRVFMFVDMKSSTTVAERLGHIQYFELLKAYYSDFSDAIIRNSGEVYQYIGDEIVISWEYDAAVRNNNCVQCFFAMKQDLKKREEWYRTKFGVAPDFKAALHYGEVTTGEIGALKKEIIFTGDVLNTTSRIQSLCAEKSVDILVSSQLMEQLDVVPYFKTRSLGSSSLRGKEEQIMLYTVSEST